MTAYVSYIPSADTVWHYPEEQPDRTRGIRWTNKIVVDDEVWLSDVWLYDVLDARTWLTKHGFDQIMYGAAWRTDPDGDCDWRIECDSDLSPLLDSPLLDPKPPPYGIIARIARFAAASGMVTAADLSDHYDREGTLVLVALAEELGIDPVHFLRAVQDGEKPDA